MNNFQNFETFAVRGTNDFLFSIIRNTFSTTLSTFPVNSYYRKYASIEF